MIHLGYSLLSDFLEDLERQTVQFGRPDVYLMSVCDRLPWQNSSLGTLVQAVTLMAVFSREEVAYLRVVVGKVMTNAGRACEPGEGEAINRAAASLLALMSSTLVDLNYHVSRATIAMPRGLITLEGDADLFLFDRESGTYRPK